MIPVLLYSHVNEPLTQSLLSSKLDQTCGLIKLPLEELLNQASIIDELNDNGVNINWSLPSGLTVSNSDDFYLINRVLSVPEELFLEFSEEDKLYSISEFRAYVAFAIEAFPHSFFKPAAFGLSGNRYSLPRQWEMIKKANLMKTPDYYLGNMDFCPLDGDLVYSNPFDFYYWKPNQNVVDIDEASFAFIKPSGMPVVANIIGNTVRVFSYYTHDVVSLGTSDHIKEISLSIAPLFNYSIAEILFFVGDNSITFGMISNIPYASNKKDWFRQCVCLYFEKLLMEIMERIRLVDISKKFEKLSLFHKINFLFQAGEIIGLSGNNGVGKTTFIKLLSGLIHPDSGQIFINGMDVTKSRKKWMSDIGTLLDGSRSLYWRLSALQNFIYFSGLKRVFGHQALLRAETILRCFDLWDVRNNKVETFSFGMKQRLALACSLSHSPSILLLDEPTSGLDTISAQILESYISSLAKENKTIILASHDHDMITRLCTRRLIIENGGVYDFL